MKNVLKTLSVGCFFGMGLFAQADLLTPIGSNVGDQEIFGDGLKFVGQSTARIGRDQASKPGNSFVLVFELPVLPAGHVVSSAEFSVNITAEALRFGGDIAWNVDLYGLRSDNSSSVDSSGVGDDVGDFFIGANDTTGATKVQDNFWVIPSDASGSPVPPVGAYTSDIAGSSALGGWLSTLYTGENPNNTYAFLRLSPDVNSTDGMLTRFLTVATGNNGTASSIPTLTITTSAVPEPMSLTLLGMGSCLLFWSRKKLVRRS